MTRLRDHPEDYEVLITKTAEATGLPEMFVEKDHWVTELLRSVSQPLALENGSAHLIFKGGTSLSKVHGIIERFSEDVDLLVVVDDLASKKAIDREVLKPLVARAAEDLDLEREEAEKQRGVKRKVYFRLPTDRTDDLVSPRVKLEMGLRGGPEPHTEGRFRSYMADHAIEHEGVARLAAEIHGVSEAWGFSSTPRPDDGYAASPAFSAGSRAAEVLRRAHDNARRLIWGNAPTYEECLETVARYGEYL